MSNLFYTKAEGPNDTLHYISGTYGLPSIFVAKTDVNTELNINWDEFLSKNISAVANSIGFNGTVHYVYGIQFLKVNRKVGNCIDLIVVLNVSHQYYVYICLI